MKRILDILQSFKTFIMNNVKSEVSGYTPLSEHTQDSSKLSLACFYLQQYMLCRLFVLSRFTLLATIFFSTNLAITFASEPIQIGLLADAIYRAEGGAKASHPYGILAHYEKTTPRQACINTIKSGLKRYETSPKDTDFITFLSKTYCPIGAKNDPSGLNRYWVKNVSFFYARFLEKRSPALKKFNHNVKHKL